MKNRTPVAEVASSAEVAAQIALYLRESKWRVEIGKLRKMVRAAGLEEAFKWRQPCYMLQGTNVAVIDGFKDYCALMFFKGALLKDPRGVLSTPGKNQTVRQLRFTGVGQVEEMESVIKAYLREAIEIERSGLKVTLKKTSDVPMPEELLARLRTKPTLKKAFEALTPGRQRGYLYYFNQAKQPPTRESRISKCEPRILAGKGLTD